MFFIVIDSFPNNIFISDFSLPFLIPIFEGVAEFFERRGFIDGHD